MDWKISNIIAYTNSFPGVHEIQRKSVYDVHSMMNNIYMIKSSSKF